MFFHPSMADTATADFDRVFAVNTRDAFLCLREAANRLPCGSGGRIVAVTSFVVRSDPTGYAAYTASKAAVEAMVRTMAKELKGTRVTANCVAPGGMATDMFFAGKSEETVRRIAETNLMERIGEAGDIAPVVGFLCIDAAEWVNGQVVRAEEGWPSIPAGAPPEGVGTSSAAPAAVRAGRRSDREGMRAGREGSRVGRKKRPGHFPLISGMVGK